MPCLLNDKLSLWAARSVEPLRRSAERRNLQIPSGAQLSFRGLPCPNLSTGGYCYHGVNEFVPVSSLVKMTDVLQELVARFA